jgi:endonuclease YncB( thermonuclease family)
LPREDCLCANRRHNRRRYPQGARAGNQLLRVRLSWIDAPEKSQAFGQRSKQHLSELVFGREVELHTRGLDRYGRTLAVVLVDGIDANLDQVRSGMAWVLHAVFAGSLSRHPGELPASRGRSQGRAARTLERSGPDPAVGISARWQEGKLTRGLPRSFLHEAKHG